MFAIGPDYDLTGIIHIEWSWIDIGIIGILMATSDHLYAKKETPHQMHNSKEVR